MGHIASGFSDDVLSRILRELDVRTIALAAMICKSWNDQVVFLLCLLCCWMPQTTFPDLRKRIFECVTAVCFCESLLDHSRRSHAALRTCLNLVYLHLLVHARSQAAGISAEPQWVTGMSRRPTLQEVRVFIFAPVHIHKEDIHRCLCVRMHDGDMWEWICGDVDAHVRRAWNFATFF